MKKVNIIKTSGDKVVFDENKLINSLRKSGANEALVQTVFLEIESKLYDNITTKEIYNTAFSILKKVSLENAARYKLKKAMLNFGSTGYPFEKFIGALLAHQGYRVKIGVIVQGHCVQHEVDVVAEKGNQHFMIECKHHKSFTKICNVKIPLYIQSRFLDVQKKWEKLEGHQHKFHQGWIVNNTRFSKDAIQYGECMGLKLLSWDYPRKNSLKEQISKFGLYPITCLNFTKIETQLLFDKDVILCKQLCENSIILDNIGITGKRKEKLLNASHNLCLGL